MIQEFSVQNFLSFRDKETISFVATKDNHLLEELTAEVKPNVRLLRMAMVFGANASGKSNLLLAINAMWKLLYTARGTKISRIKHYQPFALTKNEPIRMECIFWATGRRYQYEIEYHEREILFEKLQYTTDSDVLSLMYERKAGEDIKFGSTLEVKAQERKDLNKDTLLNHTVLSTFGSKNIKVPLLEELHRWIGRNVCELGEYNNSVSIAEEASEKPEIKKTILDLMREADFNIADFEVIEVAPPKNIIDKILADERLPENIKEQLVENQKQLIFKHKTEAADYSISFNLESTGTKTYFRLARLLHNLQTPGYIFLEDELDGTLHYELLIHYLQTFLQSPCCSQLIFTSHNLLLLDENWMVRRDMIYLTEKNKASAATQLSRVSDMGLHKNMSMLNAYRIGKLGGKPRLGSTFLPIAETHE